MYKWKYRIVDNVHYVIGLTLVDGKKSKEYKASIQLKRFWESLYPDKHYFEW
jgi:hypothetical protein